VLSAFQNQPPRRSRLSMIAFLEIGDTLTTAKDQEFGNG
jgi:hypothetical protein